MSCQLAKSYPTLRKPDPGCMITSFPIQAALQIKLHVQISKNKERGQRIAIMNFLTISFRS